MGPIEVLWGSLVVVFGLIGLVRGFLKEVGVTTVLAFLLFLLTFFAKQIAQALDMLVTLVRISPPDGLQANLVRYGVYAGVIILTAFISYQGETLAFEGRPVPGPFGIFLNLIIGLWNGYLIIGSLWYYMHKLDYPISLFGLFQQPLSSGATVMVTLLPEALIPPYGFLALAAFLIFMRVVK
ncbi:MAG: hypothetical protein ACPL7R_09455 [Anaerolineae bacterium]